MLPDLPDDAPPQQPADELEALAAQFLVRLQAGEQPDRAAVVRAHPHLGPRLERRLALAEMTYRVGLAPSQGPASATEHLDAPHPEGSRTRTPVPGGEAAARGLPPNPPDYEILAELGRGGMGIVYKARQQGLGRLVALKMLRVGAHAGPELRARFHLEAESLASLQHPNIVQVYEAGEHDGCPFLVLEYVEGGSLDRHLAAPPPEPRAAAALVETLARAMHAAHQRGIVHRDLKPANILLSGEWRVASGEQKADSSLATRHSPLATPKITDFGLAKRLAEDQGRTSTGAILGTPSYMAPEQAAGGGRPVGPSADVYALGAILYELLAGRPPFQAETALATLKRVESEEPPAPSRLGRKPPRDLETICLRCLEKEPARRYATALDLADDLRRFLAGEPITARPAGPGERTWKWAKRRPALAALIGVSALAALALAVVGISWSVQVRAERDRARHSLQVARRAIEDLYTKMASERLFDEPQLDPLCQDLLEKAQGLYEELARQRGEDPDVRRDTALAWFRLGEIHRLRGRPARAEHAYGEAIARQEKLRQDYPDEPLYRRDLANSHNWLGEVLREHARPPAEAERHYRAAQELQQELVRQFAGERAYPMELARSHYNLGIVEMNTNRPAEARADYDRAVGLLTRLHRADARDPAVRQDLARALIDRGVLHRLAGRPQDAGRDYDRAVGLLARLRQEFPARAAYHLELAVARQDRGNLLWSQGRHADARREHRQALVLLHKLVADFPGRPLYRKKLANGLKNLGTALAAGDKPAAEKHWQEARALLEALLAEGHSDTADYHGLLGMTLGYLGWLRTDQENWSAARGLIVRSIAELRAALKPNPLHPEYRQELRNQYQNLSWTLVRLRRHAAAVRAATDLAGVFPERSQDRYYAACLIARCVPLAPDRPTARRYIGQAVGLLRQAAGKASPDLKRIVDEEKVFEALASHPQFRAAQRELEHKTRPRKPHGKSVGRPRA
jgi:tetratricopeptide (TPR) repeat protein